MTKFKKVIQSLAQIKLIILSSDRSLFVAACGDGSVRLFDQRCSAAKSRVMTWREHAAWVIDCEWISVEGGANLVSGR